MKLLRKVGSTSQILQIFIADSSSTTGAGLTGLTNASAGLTAYYHRDTDTTATAITLVTMTVGTFTSSGFKEIDATNMPGWYQFCPPNAAFNSGASTVAFHLKGATNMAPLPIEVDLGAQVDVEFWQGTAVATPATAGIPDINVKNMNNVATTSITTIDANIGTTQPINFTGTGASALAKSDMVDIAGAAVSTTTAQIGTNVVDINAVSTSSVTAVDANIGTTQPINFTGTGASALAKSDMVDIAGVAVSTSSAQIGANIVNIKGTASAGAAGYVGVDWANIDSPTTVVNLSGTSIQSVNSSASGSQAINTTANSSSTITTGASVSGTYASTAALDGVYWQIADSAGTLDMYFQFYVGYLGIPVSARWTGHLNSSNDDLRVFAYNWGSSAWDQVGTLIGQNPSSDNVQTYNLTASHVGTGGNVGIVRVRFQNTGLTTSNFYTDQILLTYVQSFGGIANGSTITLGSGSTNQDFIGSNWNVVLNNQDISNAYFEGCLSITGTGTGNAGGTTPPVFKDCNFENVTLPPCVVNNSLFSGTMTVGAAGVYLLTDCKAGTVAIGIVPTFDFAAVVGATKIALRRYSGGAIIKNMAAGDEIIIEGWGTVTLDSTITGGTVTLRGNISLTDNVVGGFASVGTLTQEARVTTTTPLTVGTVNGTASNIKKNQALNSFEFVMTNSTTHAPQTGLTVTATRSIDGGVFAACANAVAELANGFYTINLAASDLNGNVISFRMTATGADDCDFTVVTTP